MQSRELPEDEIGEASQAEAAADAPYSPMLKALPASVLAKALAKRSVITLRDRLARLGNAFSRLKSQMKSRAGLQNMVQASLRHRRGLAFAALLALVPAAYLAYCIVTIPFAGGSSIQPAPSAMVFVADDGRPVAMRGILKGQSISAERIPTRPCKRGDNHRGSAVLPARRHRPAVDNAGRLARCHRPQTRRRQYHYAAIGAQALSVPGPHAQAQGAGGGACGVARS